MIEPWCASLAAPETFAVSVGGALGSEAQTDLNLIDKLKNNRPEDMTDEEVADCISRNVEHLEIMVAKD